MKVIENMFPETKRGRYKRYLNSKSKTYLLRHDKKKENDEKTSNNLQNTTQKTQD